MIRTGRLLFLLLSLCCAVAAQAQDKPGFSTTMRSNGRIYVVVAVVLVILAGLILYLVRLDRKIAKLEKQ
ncbi:MAG: CcmD family protein [Chitinophagaceae bacterium]